jgi:hypothetical protein
MFRITPLQTAVRLAEKRHLDLPAYASEGPSHPTELLGKRRARGAGHHHLLALLVVLAGLPVPLARAQLAEAVAQAGVTPAAKITSFIATPPEGHTGIIVPPASDPSTSARCPARTGAVPKAGVNAAREGTPPAATPSEGHTGIIVPPASAPRARAPRASLCQERKR